jgi:hypothetical protein
VLSLPDGTAVRGFDATGPDGLHWWRRLRADERTAGWWPLLIDHDAPRRFVEWARGSPTVGEPPDGASVLTRWLTERSPPSREEAAQWVAETMQDPDRPPRLIPRSGWDWPDHPVRLPLDARPSLGAPDQEVTLVLIPIAAGWQVPQALNYGGWNDYPLPDEHAAVLRYWNQKWGAELFAMTGTTAQFAVSRPPTTRDDALALALEWSVYNDGAYDYYNADGPMEIAASLIAAQAWFAWWD